MPKLCSKCREQEGERERESERESERDPNMVEVCSLFAPGLWSEEWNKRVVWVQPEKKKKKKKPSPRHGLTRSKEGGAY